MKQKRKKLTDREQDREQQEALAVKLTKITINSINHVLQFNNI